MAKALLGYLGSDPQAAARADALAARVRELRAECGRLAAENDRLREELSVRDTLAAISGEQLLQRDEVESLAVTQ